MPLHRIELQIADYKTAVIPFNYKGLLLLILVEDSGVEPLTEACKATVFPTIPIPRYSTYRSDAGPRVFSLFGCMAAASSACIIIRLY